MEVVTVAAAQVVAREVVMEVATGEAVKVAVEAEEESISELPTNWALTRIQLSQELRSEETWHFACPR